MTTAGPTPGHPWPQLTQHWGTKWALRAGTTEIRPFNVSSWWGGEQKISGHSNKHCALVDHAGHNDMLVEWKVEDDNDTGDRDESDIDNRDSNKMSRKFEHIPRDDNEWVCHGGKLDGRCGDGVNLWMQFSSSRNQLQMCKYVWWLMSVISTKQITLKLSEYRGQYYLTI